MAGVLKVDSINADSNLALKIANTAVAFIDATGLRPTSGNVNLDATATSKLYLPSANTVAIQTAGTTAITVDTSQKVGIGTTSPAGRLTISGGGSYAPSLSGQMLTLRSGAGVAYMTMGNGDGADSYRYIGGASATQLFGKVTDAGAVTEHMRIDSSGNLLVGTTTQPSESQARQTLATSSSTYFQFARTATTIGGSIIGTSGQNFIVQTYTGAIGSETYTERMRIDSSGNVGIGTATPLRKFHVKGSGNTSQFESTSSSGYVYIGDSASSAIDNQGIGTVGNDLSLLAGGSERMRIDSSGNVMVGTTSVSSINGGGGGSAFWNSGSNNIRRLQIGSSSTGSSQLAGWNTPNGEVGNITVSGVSTAYNTSSDYRLKEDIAPMTGALTKVSQLKPCTYKWKWNGSDGEGFIAHELGEVCPQAVTGVKDAVDEDGKPIHQSVDTSFLVATLTAAIQELKAINDTQAETINALTANLTALTARITALESTP